jgi:uncharacterized membrane protein
MKEVSLVLARYRKWVMGLALVGVLLALYLHYEYAVQETFGVCDINATFTCDAVTKGRLALFYGVPVSLIGLAGYVVIFFSSLLRKAKLAFAMTVFGMLFCLRLMFLEIFVEQVLCIICIGCQTVMLIELFLTYQLAWPEKVGLAEKNSK